MFSEFVAQNLIWVAAFVILFNLLLFSFVQGNIRGASMVSALELPQLQRDGKSVIIDVNDEKEFATAHIPDASNFPLSSINEQNSALLKHKDNTVILTCQTGTKSLKAAKTLVGLGFSDVHILRGGLFNWTKENLPVVSN